MMGRRECSDYGEEKSIDSQLMRKIMSHLLYFTLISELLAKAHRT